MNIETYATQVLKESRKQKKSVKFVFNRCQFDITPKDSKEEVLNRYFNTVDLSQFEGFGG